MTNRTPCLLLTGVVVALLLAALASPSPAAPAPPAAAPATKPAGPAKADAKPPFVRFVDDGKGGGTLETAITTYRNKDGVVVHLVAAVHVGERAYYEGLSDTFDTYDALLYELVKPKDAPVPGEAVDEHAAPNPNATRVRGAAAIGGLQSMLRNVLKLEFQLEAINYDRPNFIHADLDAETFNEMQEQRGESLFGLMLRSMLREMKRQGEGKAAAPITAFDLLAAMASPDSARHYKLLLARQFDDMEAQLAGLDGKEGSVILAERNKVALAVLRRTIADGKRNIGVFYGAGHMRGIEDEMLEKMGFTRTEVAWRTAWDMREAPKPKPDAGKAKP